MLKNATLEFEPGARVEIAACSTTAPSTWASTSWSGDRGRSATGATHDGSVTVHGHFFERESPGIVGAREVTVSSNGALVASVQQAAALTRFAFERGSRLRVKIVRK